MLSSQLEVKDIYERKLKAEIRKELLYIITKKIINNNSDEVDQFDVAIDGFLKVDRRKIVIDVLEDIVDILKEPID